MHYTKYYLLLAAYLLALLPLSAQQSISNPETPRKKGKFYFFWGYNRGFYTRSDIHLFGENYDFTLFDVVAKDRQTPFTAGVYFNPAKLTIPQCNYGVGYYLNDHYSISLSADHMKYVMMQNQTVKISGAIKDSDTPYNGAYVREDIVVKEDLLIFEHTDGLNYIVLELNRHDNLLPQFTRYRGRKLEVNLSEGLGMGGLYPRTNTTLLSKNRNDAFHLAGYGLSAKVGLEVVFLKHFYISTNLKAGWIHMPDIRTTASKSDHASQRFGFAQHNLLFGARF
jgi:hypothetical protein